MKRWIPHIVHATTVTALLGLCLWVVYQRQLPPDPMTRKIDGAERLSYQVVTRTQGPRFELIGNERIVKVVSHAVLDSELAFDPRRVVSYGLHLQITHQGRALWQHDAIIDSRQSKAGRVGTVWMQENAFTSRLDTQLTDDRMLLVHLPAAMPAGSALEMTLLGEPEEALVRVYKLVERPEDAQLRALRRLDESGGKVRYARSTYVPWSLLPEDDKLERLSHTYQRMTPMGEPGMDFVSRSVFYTGFRSPMEAMDGDKGLALQRHRALAFNVLGSTMLRLELRRAPADPSRPEVPGGPGAVVRIRAVSEAMPGASQDAANQGATDQTRRSAPDEPLTWELPVPAAQGPEAHVIEVPAGLHSLQLFTDARDPLWLDVFGPPMSQLGAVPYLEHDLAERRLVPDERRLTVYETGPEQVPVVAGIFVPDDLRARILRLDVRILIEPAPPGVADQPPLVTSSFTTTVTIEFLGDNERVLATRRHEIEAPYAPFERLERADGDPVSVSESVGLRVVAPARTQWLRVIAARGVAVRLYRFLAGPDAYQAPYADVPLTHTRWRYAPRDRRQWFHVVPINAPRLAEAEQRAILVAQVRLEAEPEPEAAPEEKPGRPGPAVAVAPLGRPERHSILEPVPPQRFVRMLARWPAGTATRLPPGQPMRFRFGGPARPRLDYSVPAAHLGKTLTLRVDGASLATVRFTTTRGYWYLPQIAAGGHDVEAITEAAGAVLYLDQPPAPAAAGGPARFELVRRRTVYALGSEPLEVEVRKHAGNQVRVTMMVYAPWPEAQDEVEVRAVIGGGVPRRVPRVPFPRLTVADRSLPLPSAEASLPAAFADHDGLAGYPRSITVPLGDDLVAGNHRIGFSVAGTTSLWARFFVTHVTPTPEDRALQWRFEVDDAPFSGPAPGADEPPAQGAATPAGAAAAPPARIAPGAAGSAPASPAPGRPAGTDAPRM